MVTVHRFLLERVPNPYKLVLKKKELGKHIPNMYVTVLTEIPMIKDYGLIYRVYKYRLPFSYPLLLNDVMEYFTKLNVVLILTHETII